MTFQTVLPMMGGLLCIISAIPYLAHTLQGKTHPNIVTWFTWSLMNAIATSAAFSDGATQTAIFAGGALVATSSITLASLVKQGVHKYTRFDIFCQIVALIGILLWQLTDQPAIAIAINLVAELFGYTPTLRHAWREPQHETWQTFALTLLGSALTLVALTTHTFVSLAYPVYFLIVDTILVAVIIGRRRALGVRHGEIVI